MSGLSAQLPQRAQDELIHLIAREVTADPEQIDIRRRQERFAACVARANEIRAEKRARKDAGDRRKDEELEAKLKARPPVAELDTTQSIPLRSKETRLDTSHQLDEVINPPLIAHPLGVSSKPLTLLLAQPVGAKASRLPGKNINKTDIEGQYLARAALPNVSSNPERYVLEPIPPRPADIQIRPAATETHIAQNEQPRAHPQPNEPDNRLLFAISHIVNKQKRQGEFKYRIRWEPSWVNLNDVHEGNEGKQCVAVQQKYWNIVEKLRERVRNGVKQCKVRWEDTWEPQANINPSDEDKVAVFEARRLDRRRSRAQTIRQRRILTIAESNFPRDRVLPQSEEDYAAAQRHVASSWPEIKPHGLLDLYPAIYQIQVELLGGNLKASHGGKTYLSLLNRPQVRKLRWREEYVKSGRTYKYSRCRRNALILQVVGIQDDHDRCSRCSGEEDLVVPFEDCIRSGHTQTSWFENACTNCAIQRGKDCTHYSGMAVRGPRPNRSNRYRRPSGDRYRGSEEVSEELEHELASSDDDLDDDGDDGGDDDDDEEEEEEEEEDDEEYNGDNGFDGADGDDDDDDLQVIDSAMAVEGADNATPEDINADMNQRSKSPAQTSDADGIMQTIETDREATPEIDRLVQSPASTSSVDGASIKLDKAGKLRRVNRTKTRQQSPGKGPSNCLLTPPTTVNTFSTPIGTRLTEFEFDDDIDDLTTIFNEGFDAILANKYANGDRTPQHQHSPRLPEVPSAPRDPVLRGLDQDAASNGTAFKDNVDSETNAGGTSSPSNATPFATAREFTSEVPHSPNKSAMADGGSPSAHQPEIRQSREALADTPALSEKARGKRRAVSQPPTPERPTTRPRNDSTVEPTAPPEPQHAQQNRAHSNDPVLGPSTHPRSSSYKRPCSDSINEPTTSTKSQSTEHNQGQSNGPAIGPSTRPRSSSAKITRNDTHDDCIAGQPCQDPVVGNYNGSDSSAIIYHNTLHANHPTTVAHVEYILSRCNCHWASFFGLMWRDWCRQTQQDNPYDSLANLLLHPTWHNDFLQHAAADCCPRGEIEVISLLDDD